MTGVNRIEELADRLAEAMPCLDASDQRTSLTLLRELALGAPVSSGRLATAARVSAAQITDALDRLPAVVRDDQQRVVGFMGLTVIDMGNHRLHFDGRALSAWCAWDTLFLPELLGETVRVTSRSPASDEAISLSVTPSGPTDLQPADTVVSFRLPKTDFDADVIQRFCHFVHFFASPDDGEQWTRKQPGTFLLSVDDAYRLGQLTNHAVFGAVLATAGPS
jgi:alkylmercury lyase